MSGVRQGCPLSPFLFNFVIDEIMEECLKGTTESGVQVLPGDKLVDLDYADDIVLLFDCQETHNERLTDCPRLSRHSGCALHLQSVKCCLKTLICWSLR
ncbi:reverse transcriptase domain-containing protein [Acinetobacter baumannii]|uniref:reverse transcriptase domain-containing protein n=1 Tax=Acinetobacter baumannii TaxID=470 RepID=UPI003390EFD2